MARRGPLRPPGETRRLVSELREEGLSYSQIAERIGTRKSTVAYHVRRLGHDADERFARRYDWAEIQATYDTGASVRECAKEFGFSQATWHKAVQRGDVVSRPRSMPIEELLVAGRNQTGRDHLKRRLLAEGIKKNKCENCGITDWLGAPLSMALHHINGDGKDNRIENLSILCPNCHAQTDTYGGRNGHRRRKAA